MRWPNRRSGRAWRRAAVPALLSARVPRRTVRGKRGLRDADRDAQGKKTFANRSFPGSHGSPSGSRWSYLMRRPVPWDHGAWCRHPSLLFAPSGERSLEQGGWLKNSGPGVKNFRYRAAEKLKLKKLRPNPQFSASANSLLGWCTEPVSGPDDPAQLPGFSRDFGYTEMVRVGSRQIPKSCFNRNCRIPACLKASLSISR